MLCKKPVPEEDRLFWFDEIESCVPEDLRKRPNDAILKLVVASNLR